MYSKHRRFHWNYIIFLAMISTDKITFLKKLKAGTQIVGDFFHCKHLVLCSEFKSIFVGGWSRVVDPD
jgi:hypothetical protein